MDIAQKALYNSLRMAWIQDNQLPVESWKVEDYRTLELDELFSRLHERKLLLDRSTFKEYADQFDSPEALNDALIDDEKIVPEEYDQLYLLVFELWRRLVPEKPSISILCDELDYQIFEYDLGRQESRQALQDALNNFYSILEENVDQGMACGDVFAAIAEFCANDVEGFLYDYIAETIDLQEYSYASELLEQFSPFVVDKKWFDLLHARIVNVSDIHAANKMIEQLFEQNRKENCLEFYLDVLTFMVQGGNYKLFSRIVEHVLSIIQSKEDFLELLLISSDFFRCLDREEVQLQIDQLISQCEVEEKAPLSFTANSPYVVQLKKLLA